MGTNGFGLVVYAVALERVATFYRRVLALDVVAEDVDHVVLRAASSSAGDNEVVVLQIPDKIAAGIQIDVPAVRRESTALKPVFFVDDLNAVAAAVSANGGTMLSEQTRWRFADTLVHDGADPEGNVIQFRQPI